MDKKNTLRGKDKIKGLVPVLVSPMNSDETIDEEGVERLSQFILSYPHFKAVWTLATAGEDENLPSAIIDDYTRLFVKYFGNKIPVLVKTSTPGTNSTIERTKRMADMGIHAAIVHFQHKMMSQDHARRYYLAVADSSPLPIFIYNNYVRGANLDKDLILELSEHPNIAGMKAGGSNISQLQQLCLLAHEDFSVMIAGGGQIMAGFAMGASAHSSVPLQAFPEKAAAIYEYIQAGRLREAQAEQKRVIEFLRRMPKLKNREVNGEVKCILEIRGIIKRHVSAPFIEATNDQKKEFERLIEELQIFSTIN